MYRSNFQYLSNIKLCDIIDFFIGSQSAKFWDRWRIFYDDLQCVCGYDPNRLADPSNFSLTVEPQRFVRLSMPEKWLLAKQLRICLKKTQKQLKMVRQIPSGNFSVVS